MAPVKEDPTGPHNEATGGHNVVQAQTIHGDVHFHGSRNSTDDGDMPIIVSVWRRCDTELVIDGNPPTTMPLSGHETVRVTMEAHSTQAVILRALRPVVVARRPPRPASRHGHNATSANFVELNFVVHLDLDATAPRLETQGADFPRTVTASAPEGLRLAPRVGKHEVWWQLELDWTSAGRHGTVVINEAGAPFALYPHDGPILDASDRSAKVQDLWRRYLDSPEYHQRKARRRASERMKIVRGWRDYATLRGLDPTFRQDLNIAADELEVIAHKQAQLELTTQQANTAVGNMLRRLVADDPERRRFVDWSKYKNLLDNDQTDRHRYLDDNQP
jgi:ribosomal protein L32E